MISTIPNGSDYVSKLDALVGSQVEATMFTDMVSSNPITVAGIFRKRDPNLSDDGPTNTYYVETEDNRHLRVYLETVELLPEEQPTVLEFNSNEAAVLKMLIVGLVKPWEQMGIEGWVIAIIGQEAAEIFMLKIGLMIDNMNDFETPSETALGGTESEPRISQVVSDSSELENHDAPCRAFVGETVTKEVHGIKVIDDVGHLCSLPLGHSGDHE